MLSTWSIPSFPDADLDVPILGVQNLNESDINRKILIFTFLVSNYSAEHDAEILIQIKTIDDVVKFTWNLLILQASSPVVLDSVMGLVNGDRITVTSNIKEVAIFATGDLS